MKLSYMFMMRRKLFQYTFSTIIGISVAFFLKAWTALICAFILCIFALVLKHSSIRKSVLLFCALGILLFLLKDYGFAHGGLSDGAKVNEPKHYVGMVTRFEKIGDDDYQLVIEINNNMVLANYYQCIEQPWELIGCKISFLGNIHYANENGNPRCFDYRLYLKTRNIGYVSTIDSFQIENCPNNIQYRFQRFVLKQRDLFLEEIFVSEKSSGLIKGVLFGDTNGMDEESYNAFRQNGTAHVLAVSGLHVGMLYSIYRPINKKLHSKSMTISFFFFLLMYGTATLWSVSVTRAILLIILTIIGERLNRRFDLLTALAAVAFLSILKNPYVIFGASFQMSFLAVLSIVFLKEPLDKFVGTKFSTPAAVQIGLMPYMAYVFNYISFIGLLCNIPIVFLISVLVPIGMGGFILYFIFQSVIPNYPMLLDGLANMVLLINEAFCADGIFSFDVVSPPFWLLILFYGFVFYGTSEQALIYFGRKEWKRAVLPIVLIISVAAVSSFADDTPFDQADLIFVDVGQGDCLHIKDDAGQDIIIDGGGNINYNVGEKILKPYFLKNGCMSIDLAAATHLHTDHYLGIKQLKDCFEVKQELIRGKAGDIIRIRENTWIEILWPLKYDGNTDDENLNSLIFMIHQKDIKTLVTGDLTEEGEKMLTNTYKGTKKLEADILKVAHHGSAYSTCDVFLKAVNPDIAVICVGKNNYGHPSEIVIEKLEKNGIMVFRTDLDGAVGIINSKGKISVCTEKQR